MEEIRKILSEISLSKYKIETYLSLLKITTGTIQQIAKNSSVPACKLYESLRWLHEQGYITLVSQKPLSYRANNPKTVIQNEIEENKERLEQLEHKLEQINFSLPVAEKDIVQITTTRDAYFKKIKESVRESKKSIFYIAQHWRVDAELIRLLEQKIKEGVTIKALGPIIKRDKQKISWLNDIGIKIKNIRPKETHFAIYDNSLVIISLRKQSKKSDYSAIWLKSETLARILTDYFNNLWKETE